MADPALLARIALFAGLGTEDLAGLARDLRRRRYKKDEVIFFCGDPGASLCIIEAGRVKLTLPAPDGRGEVVLARLSPGEFFGELALLDGQPRSADAVATEAVELLMLGREDFLRYLEAHPRLAIALLEELSRRLRRDAEIIQDAAFLDIPGRLARVLLRLAETEGQPGSSGTAISARLTQTDLAGMVGATRESVNKWLGVYERRGLLRRQGGRIDLLRPEELHKQIG